MKCNLKDRLASGDTAIGTWVTVGHPDIPDIFESLKFDFLVLDSEHAPLGPETLASMVQAVDAETVCPLVRVGAAETAPVKAALDMGAHGVVFPMVNDGGGAREAVSLTKYPPEGSRGVAPRKAAGYGASFAQYIREANRMTTVVVQVETARSVANLEEILSARGVDVAFVGPSDLTMSMGFLDDRGNQKVVDAMKTVVAACKKHGVTSGVLAATPEEAKRDLELGFGLIALGSDTRFLLGGARVFLQAVGRA
jgi:4-hydroxy-2-oxoheptanedioate aldolase